MARNSRLRSTAYHEAGHAMAAFVQGIRFRYVTIIPDSDNWGHFQKFSSRLSEEGWYDTSPLVRDRLERHIVVGLAGREAQRLITRRYDHRGASSDYRNALNLVVHLVGSSEEANAYFRWLQVRAHKLVSAPFRRPLLDALAVALLERQTIDGKEAATIMIKAGRDAIAARAGK
jgi:Peptidase family M41